jgi:hypothetical protein
VCVTGMRSPPEPSATVLVVDVGGLRVADLETVDALARLSLVTKRLGRPLVLRDVPAELRELIVFAGLAEALPCEAPTPRAAATGRTAGRAGPCPGRT